MRIICMSGFLITFIFAGISPLFASASAMGHLVTVGSDGAFDVTRNPATMMNQTKPNAFGYILQYRPYSYDSYREIDLSGASSEEGEKERKYDYTGGLFISYCHRWQDSAFGMAISSGNAEQIQYMKTVDTISSSAGYGSTTTKKTMAVSPSLVLSYASKVRKHSFIGFQINSEYYLSDVEEEEEDTTGKEVEKNEQKTRYSFEAVLGFFYKDSKDQFGVAISTGKLFINKSKLDYDYYDPSGPVSFSGSQEISNHIYYGQGMAIATGAYSRLSQSFGMGLEGIFMLPVYYTEKSYREDTTALEYKVEEETAKLGLQMALRGGMEWFVSPAVVFSAGLGISTFDSSMGSDDDSVEVKSEYDIVFLTLGLEYFYSEHSRIIFQVSSNMVTADLSLETSSVSLDAKVLSIENYLLIGASSEF